MRLEYLQRFPVGWVGTAPNFAKLLSKALWAVPTLQFVTKGSDSQLIHAKT